MKQLLTRLRHLATRLHLSTGALQRLRWTGKPLATDSSNRSPTRKSSTLKPDDVVCFGDECVAGPGADSNKS